MRRKKIYVAYTGGTIGMQQTDDGYKPMGGYLADQMKQMPELSADVMPEYVINEYPVLLDSADMSPIHWSSIARAIEAHYDAYDGFVVLHGTDTMAYTASALPFMLQGLQKPVVITGAQIPLSKVRNDARENLITALLIAANFKIPEVCLCFGDKLLRGNRAVKVDSDSLDAFKSPNFPPLGTVGIEIKINWDLVLPLPKTRKTVKVTALTSESIR